MAARDAHTPSTADTTAAEGPRPRVSGRAAVVVVLLLLAGGSALLAFSFATREQVPNGITALALPAVSPRPSPTWGPLPTRAAAPPALTRPDLFPLQRALLRGDLDAAEEAWTDAYQRASALPADAGPLDPELFRAGARLALMAHDYTGAEVRIWVVIGALPQDARAWSLLGLALDGLGDVKGAGHALGIALALDPNLSPELFNDQWATALKAQDTRTLVALAERYSVEHPDAPLGPYYRGEALLASGDPTAAIEVLVEALRQAPHAPALLWYTLGNAYLARGGYQEAAVVLEVAADEFVQGDTSLAFVSEDPLTDLNVRLARAYLATERCAEAEAIYRRLSVQDPSLAHWVEEAVICQTPTPTLTPWIPPRVTATPRY